MNKKKLLFVIDSLGIGGAEKSLVTLLNLLDYEKYEVDLQLFARGGTFEQFLPTFVEILPTVRPSIIGRIAYSIALRLRKRSAAGSARVYWKTIGRFLPTSSKCYDVAIGYGQCLPTFYVIDKVNAKSKYVWVNCVFHLSGKEQAYQRQFYKNADGIAVVSPEALEYFQGIYPEYSGKMYLIKDIYDGKLIEAMSLLPAEKDIDHSTTIIMTAGRLNKPQKGYDIALEVCKVLRDRGISFKWYAVGDGSFRKEMEEYIVINHLENYFILLGATPNPYAYMRQCDIYVQTSRFEGFGLTVAEARMLNRPVVCTNFDACHMQLIDGKNGLITSFDPEDIADNIQRLMNDKELYNRIQKYQQQEKNGNTEELQRFYELING